MLKYCEAIGLRILTDKIKTKNEKFNKLRFVCYSKKGKKKTVFVEYSIKKVMQNWNIMILILVSKVCLYYFSFLTNYSGGNEFKISRNKPNVHGRFALEEDRHKKDLKNCKFLLKNR